MSENDAISIFIWSLNKFYHSLLGSQIKTVVQSCHPSKRQRTNQKDKEPLLYKINSAEDKKLHISVQPVLRNNFLNGS